MDDDSQVIYEKKKVIFALIIIKAVQYRSQNREIDKQKQMESINKFMLT